MMVGSCLGWTFSFPYLRLGLERGLEMESVEETGKEEIVLATVKAISKK